MIRFKASVVTAVFAGLVAGCGGANYETKEDKDEDSNVAADPGTDEPGDDPRDDVVSSPAIPMVVVELVTGALAFDFGVAKAKIDGKVTFEASESAKIGIEDIYYGTTLVVGNVEKKTAVEVEGWAISSNTDDKSWMDTSCGENKPGPDGTTTDICHIVGPIVDAQKEIQELPDAATQDDVLKILETRFAEHDFKVVATGAIKYETEGNQTTKVELKP